MRQLFLGAVSIFGPWIVLAGSSAALVVLNTDFVSPPRFDGAGYAVLGDALATGRGYREIDKPDAPRHAHFPPGYPAALALLWRCTGRSVVAAHVFAVLCTVSAVLLAWRWLGTIYSRRAAFILGLALAVNWSWGRSGGSIQSEPLYVLVQSLAVIAVVKSRHRDAVSTGVLVGLALAACVLTRHVGLCFAAAVIVDLGLRRQWRTLGPAVLVAGVLLLPWGVWLWDVRHHTQVGLLADKSLAGRIPGQAVFYLQRLPDQITGPFVEVATSFGRSAGIVFPANLWATVATGLIFGGWISTLRTSRRRLAGLIGSITLTLLFIWPFTEAGRLLFPIVPFLLVGASEGVARVAAITGIGRSRDWACGMVLAVSIPYSIYAVATGRAEAQRLTHADFDAACQWINQNAAAPGPVLTRYPGEVFWQTRRQAVAPDSPDPEAVDQLMRRFGVSYFLIDEDRFLKESANPLSAVCEALSQSRRARLGADEGRRIDPDLRGPFALMSSTSDCVRLVGGTAAPLDFCVSFVSD